MITSAEVLNAKFTATKFREGYDQDQVDDFLDRVVATLRAREAGRPEPAAVSVVELDGRTFTTTKFRQGYEIQDVDALVQRVRETLLTAPAAVTPAVSANTVPGLIQQPKGWRRLLGG